MPTILKEHANCRLYVKGEPPHPRYFISQKTNNLRRLQLTKESASNLKGLPDKDFTQGVAIMLDNAKSLGRSDYFEVSL